MRQGTGFVIAAVAGLAILLGVGGKPLVRPKIKPYKGPGDVPTWGKPTPGTVIDPAVTGFDPTSAGVWVSEDCSVVMEGVRFWPAGAPLGRNPDKDGTPTGKKYDPAIALGRACIVTDVRGLATTEDPDCTGLDYVDTQLIDQGVSDPIDIARSIIQQVAPMCAAVEPEYWSDAVFSWYNDLVARLTTYLDRKIGWLEG